MFVISALRPGVTFPWKRPLSSTMIQLDRSSSATRFPSRFSEAASQPAYFELIKIVCASCERARSDGGVNWVPGARLDSGLTSSVGVSRSTVDPNSWASETVAHVRQTSAINKVILSCLIFMLTTFLSNAGSSQTPEYDTSSVIGKHKIKC